jgi:hypothetical protein
VAPTSDGPTTGPAGGETPDDEVSVLPTKQGPQGGDGAVVSSSGGALPDTGGSALLPAALSAVGLLLAGLILLVLTRRVPRMPRRH